MTFFLLKAIESLLAGAFQNTVFRDPDTEVEKYISPRIVIGALPPKRSAEDEKDFPFIVIRPSEGEDDDRDSFATVKIIFGSYTAEGVEGGFNDVMNMIDRGRRHILANQLLDRKFVLNPPVKWKLGDEEGGHPHPYYHGSITAMWSMPPVEPLLSAEENMEVFSSGYP